MKIAIRYYTQTGNTKKLAQAIAEALGVEAKDITCPLEEKTDILFLCNSVYWAGIDRRVKAFVKANADKIVQSAEAQKASRIAEAEGQVARFNEMYEQYAINPLITKQRLFYETMEDVLPDMKVIISDGGTQTMYPIESFSTIPNNSTEQEDN